MPVKSSWIFTFLLLINFLYLLFCLHNHMSEDKPIILLQDEKWSEETRCPTGNGNCDYVLRGQVNISNITIQTVALIIDDKLPHFCVIYFNTRCEENNTDICYCRSTIDTYIYDLVFNIYLKNISMNVRAVILMIDKKIFSDSFTLPAISNVSDLDFGNETSVRPVDSNGIANEYIILIVCSGPLFLIVLTVVLVLRCTKCSKKGRLRCKKKVCIEDEIGNSYQYSDSAPDVVKEQSAKFLGGDVNLFMIANSKDGKSATGNSILGARIFESSVKTEAITKTIRRECTSYDEINYAVFDGPGFHLSDQIDSSLGIILKSLDEAFKIAREGFDVFLLIVRFGTAVIDKSHINELKNVLGGDFLNKYGIIIITYKDAFNKDEEECDSIEQWVSKEQGYFKSLVEECQGRIVYFDNRSRNDTVIEEQRSVLFNMIRSVREINKMQRCKRENEDCRIDFIHIYQENIAAC